MRADRLVAIVLLLQSKPRVTAAEVAEELEISTRTARRDLEALAMAGVPVYSQPGRNGGWSLIGGATTDLTGLQAPEAQALFLAAGQAASSLGTSPALRTALAKLTQALPQTFREDAQTAASAVVIDPTTWGHAGPTLPADADAPLFLAELQQAVIERRQVELGYRTPKKGSSLRTVHPLGLVTKAGVWYLVAHTDAGGRTFRVSRVESVEQTGEPAVRPDGFDLAAVWRDITVGYVEHSSHITASGWAAPWTAPILRRVVGGHFTPGPEREDGWFAVELRGYSARALAAQFAGLAGGLQIIEPEAVRDELATIGAALVEEYRTDAAAS